MCIRDRDILDALFFLDLLAALPLRLCLEQQAERSRKARALHDIGQAARILRTAQTHRHVKNLLAQLDHAGHHAGAACQDDAGRQHLLEAGAAQFVLDQFVELLDPRLNHISQRPTCLLYTSRCV